MMKEFKVLGDVGNLVPVVLQGMMKYYKAKDKIDHHPSNHGFFELSYASNGEVSLEVEGKEILLHEGDSVVIFPSTDHNYTDINKDAELIVIYFEFKEKQEAQKDETEGFSIFSLENFEEILNGNHNGYERTQSYFIVDGHSRKAISLLVEEILIESEDQGYGHNILMNLYANELALHTYRILRRIYDESMVLRAGASRELVEIGKKYIHDNYIRDISVADIANYVYLSPNYFTKVFKEQFGVSPKAYLNTYRLCRAKDYLEGTNIKLTSIAKKTGFSSPQRFSAAFKRELNISPSQYRKKMSKKK